MNQITKLAFFDELTKISARWREALRLGEIGAPEVKRLRGSGLLNYGKEIKGLNRGSKNIMKRYGIEVRHAGPSYAKNLGDNSLGEFNNAKNRITLAGTYPGKTMLERKANRALVRRHEADEARTFHKLKKKYPVRHELGDAMEDRRFSTHTGPSVMAREHRNVSFMPPSLRKQRQDVGYSVGKEYRMTNAMAGKGWPGALRKRDVNKIDKVWADARRSWDLDRDDIIDRAKAMK